MPRPPRPSELKARRVKRQEARDRIVQAVNRYKLTMRRSPTLVSTGSGMQWAVFVARQRRLVPAKVLVAAGYKAVR